MKEEKAKEKKWKNNQRHQRRILFVKLLPPEGREEFHSSLYINYNCKNNNNNNYTKTTLANINVYIMVIASDLVPVGQKENIYKFVVKMTMIVIIRSVRVSSVA